MVRVDSLIQLSEYDSLDSMLFQAQAKFQKAGNNRAYVQTFPRLVRLYESTRRNDQVPAVIKEGLEAGEKYLEPGAAVLGSLHMMQGEHLVGQGDLENGLAQLRKGWSILKQSEDYEDQTWCCCDLIVTHFLTDRLDSARYYLDRGQAVCNAHLPPGHDAYPTLLSYASLIYTKLGEYQKGLEASIQRAELQEGIIGYTAKDTLELGNAYNSIASTYYLMGDVPRAIPYFQKALSLIRNCSTLPEVALGRTLNNLGVAYQAQNRSEEALQFFLLARDNLANPPNLTAAKETYFNLANLIDAYVQSGEFDKARHLIEEAFATGQQWNFSLEFPHYFNGILLCAESKLAEARESYQASMNEIYRTGSKDIFKIGQKALAIGEVWLQDNQADSALTYLQKAIDNFSYDFNSNEKKENPDPDGYFPDWRILTTMEKKGQALYQLWTSNPADTSLLYRSHQSYLTGINIFQQFRSGYETPGAKLNLTKTGLPLFEGAIITLLDLFEITQDASLPVQAFQLAEQSKGIALLEAQWEAQAKGSTLISDELREDERQLHLDLAFLRKQIKREESKDEKTDSLKLDTWNNLVFEKEKALEAWTETVQVQHPNYLKFKERKGTITVQQVQDSILETTEGMVAYFAGQQELISFVITHQGLKYYRTPRPNSLHTEIAQLYRCLSDYDFVMDSTALNYKAFVHLSNNLYELLLDPILTDQPELENLVIVPDGPLHQIPFEVLLTSEAPELPVDFLSLPYAINQFRIRYGYSATLLLEVKRRKRHVSKAGLLALAPSYEGKEMIANRGNFALLRNGEDALPGAQREVQTIAKTGLEGEFLFGSEVDEAQFKQMAPDYQILHLAMHGTSDQSNPLYSYLSFNGQSADTSEDQNLYAYELLALSLQSELAVLSACESGWGQLQPGEGVMSLGRTFMASGTRSVVMTLWQIDDKSSAELMDRFYRHLKDGERMSDALHQAKKDFLQNADSRTAHPYHWAAFIPQGDSQPIKGSDNSLIWLALGLWLFIIGLGVWIRKKAKESRAA